jgi:Arc/MetJ-type ribon-helix-helix transcriptional regulator
MTKIVKIAISLPEQLLDDVDRRRRAAGASRSSFFREAVEARLAASQRSDVERYVDGYTRDPETAEEIQAATDSAVAMLAALSVSRIRDVERALRFALQLDA